METMKKLCFIFILALILSFSSCMAPVDTSSDLPSDTNGDSITDTSVNTDPPIDTREYSDAVKAATEALFKEYPMLEKLGTAPFEIEEREHTNDADQINISFDLMLCGLNTYESYYVTLIRDGDDYTVQRCFGSNEGKYSKFFFECTDEKIEAAKAKIETELDPDFPSSGFYLTTDIEGALILQCEQIIDLTPPAGETGGGCGIDHEHRFYEAVICK